MTNDLNKYIDLIKLSSDDLNIANYSINDSGADNLIIIVNNDLVFKFPKQEIFYKKEKQFLDYIRPHISTIIPNIKIYDFKGQKFTCHKIIDGISYHELTNIEKSKSVEAVSDELAKFFAELHSIEVKNDFPKNNQHYYLDSEQERAIIENMTEEFVEDFAKTREYLLNYDGKSNMCICHDDLHYGNIIVKNNKLSGIIDFGDIVVENYNLDFCQLYLRDFNAVFENNFTGLGELTIKKYEKISNRKVNRKYLNYRVKGKIYKNIAKSILSKNWQFDDLLIKKILKINELLLNC